MWVYRADDGRPTLDNVLRIEFFVAAWRVDREDPMTASPICIFPIMDSEVVFSVLPNGCLTGYETGIRTFDQAKQLTLDYAVERWDKETKRALSKPE